VEKQRSVHFVTSALEEVE